MKTESSLETDFVYPSTRIQRRLFLTIVPVSADAAIVHADDVTERIELQRAAVDVEERERRRIGCDIHDGLGQSLTAISLALQQLSRQLEHDGSPHRPAVLRIAEAVRTCVGDAGRIARSLTPVIAESHGLCEALAQLAKRSAPPRAFAAR